MLKLVSFIICFTYIPAAVQDGPLAFAPAERVALEYTAAVEEAAAEQCPIASPGFLVPAG